MRKEAKTVRQSQEKKEASDPVVSRNLGGREEEGGRVMSR